MDKCGICLKPAEQLFETGNDGVYACFKCQPLVPEVTIGDSEPTSSEHSNDEIKQEVTNLNQHRKRHLSGRPLESSYQCPVCGEQFAQRNHMYTHRREAHSVLKASLPLRVRFACSYCDVKVATERHLQAHIAQHHSEDPEDDNDERPVRTE
ncbi:unnamed protein product [Leptidea sinapis]|uniref:C2H2-type domain-containing protein n=1 Tax=Leptidea sinapis TaxID=189913 RepID=A0A5E4PWT9_9NEOP|nr:unnamed protein product [Leptidea sinapis]